MKNLITREAINENIIFHSRKHRSFDDLCYKIDGYKNLLEKKYNVKEGDSVLNALNGIDAIAFFIASCELGMVTIVTSVTTLSKDKFFDSGKTWIDAKTKQVMPIDYFVVRSNREEYIPKDMFFKEVSEHMISMNTLMELDDFSPNHTINAKPDSIIMRCTSSGTTGTPKRIEHTHQFMRSLCDRNSEQFYGTIAGNRKFLHGSSFATYFLPTLMSKDVTDIHTIGYTTNIHKTINQNVLDNIDHIQFPYTDEIQYFLDQDISYPHLTVYTLAAIRPEWVQHVGTKVKDIISMYGMSETSGPVLINKASNYEFAPNKFYPMDDFYNLDIVDGHLSVNQYVSSDKFTKQGTAYIFHGRDDLIRINDVELPLQQYNSYVENGEVIVDSLYNKIYLALWETTDVEEIQSKFDSRHIISKSEVLDKSMFMSGIKIDIQALREHFRS